MKTPSGAFRSSADGIDQVVDQSNPNIFLTSFSQRMGFVKMVDWIVNGLKPTRSPSFIRTMPLQGRRDAVVRFLKKYNKELVVDIRPRTSRPISHPS